MILPIGSDTQNSFSGPASPRRVVNGRLRDTTDLVLSGSLRVPAWRESTCSLTTASTTATIPKMKRTHGSSGRWLALDGIRALAVLAVVGVHLGFGFTQGGGYGVDVFFVLSGFLITGLLLDEEAKTGTISRKAFYARRALRLLPPLAIVIVLSVALDLTATRGGGHMLTAVPATLFYVGNWVVSFNSQALGFLGQTWSLAIEEQFYLLWPLVLVVPRLRQSMHRWLPWAILVSFGGRAIGEVFIGSQVSVWTPLRADGLLLGALVAVQARRGGLPSWMGRPLIAGVVTVVGGVLVVRGYLAKDGIGLFVIAVCASTLIAHLVLRTDGIAARILSVKPLVIIGRVSYGIYLYHYAIILWLEGKNVSGTQVRLITIAFTAAMTTASWLLVEQPLLRVKHRFGRTELRLPEGSIVDPDPDEVDSGSVRLNPEMP